MIDRQDRW